MAKEGTERDDVIVKIDVVYTVSDTIRDGQDVRVSEKVLP